MREIMLDAAKKHLAQKNRPGSGFAELHDVRNPYKNEKNLNFRPNGRGTEPTGCKGWKSFIFEHDYSAAGTQAEIAENFGISEYRVRSRLETAQALLKEMLGPAA